MELSNRLETIASFVTEGYVVADIGTDHGYIPIYLTSNGNCPRAYAMDVNKEPLSRAKTHIEEDKETSLEKSDIQNLKQFLIEEYEVNEKCLEIN